MTDFKNITEDQMNAAKLKFTENNLGVQMNKLASGVEAKWGELTDPELYSINQLRNKMLEVAVKINTSCDDPILGDTSVAFTHTTGRGKKVKVTFFDIYLFLRSAFLYQKETAEYKKAQKEARELKKFIDQNKSTEDKLKEATGKLSGYTEKFGEDLVTEE